MTAILAVLTAGVDVLIKNNLLPLAAIFIEPAKVLFLNNAINHGIFTPIGAEQVKTAGQSIMYMLEANPGPGLGVLIAAAVSFVIASVIIRATSSNASIEEAQEQMADMKAQAKGTAAVTDAESVRKIGRAHV